MGYGVRWILENVHLRYSFTDMLMFLTLVIKFSLMRLMVNRSRLLKASTGISL